VVAAGMAVFSLFRRSSYVSIPLMRKLKIRFSRSAARSIWHLAMNTSLENIAARIGFLATAMIAARLGTDEFAAHNIGMSILGLGFSFADGMQVAAVALAGQSLGAGEKEQAKRYGSICQRIGLLISFILALLLFFGGRWFYSLYFTEPHILEMGEIICRYLMVIVLLQISQIIFTGCLRAAGDVRYVLVAAMISIAGIRTGSTLLMVNVFGWGLHGVWLGILADQLSRFIMVSLRFKQGKWVDLKI
jgi:Na+-driven multidrug efflux pump